MGAYTVIKLFEEEIAQYAGSKYAVAISSCTNALFLCCLYEKVEFVHIPKYTYPGVACSIINSGGKVFFHNEHWQGVYKLRPYDIYDSALRFKKDMYIKNSLYCLSFHAKKHIPIGRGGMILTDNDKAVEWLKRARFDGRPECDLKEAKELTIGWNMYMTPEQAARGLTLFGFIKNKDLPDLEVNKQDYIDLSLINAYKRW
jgi:dTDP-4-amino-4,6-dideoxygalactose transaminase